MVYVAKSIESSDRTSTLPMQGAAFVASCFLEKRSTLNFTKAKLVRGSLQKEARLFRLARCYRRCPRDRVSISRFDWWQSTLLFVITARSIIVFGDFSQGNPQSLKGGVGSGKMKNELTHNIPDEILRPETWTNTTSNQRTKRTLSQQLCCSNIQYSTFVASVNSLSHSKRHNLYTQQLQ